MLEVVIGMIRAILSAALWISFLATVVSVTNASISDNIFLLTTSIVVAGALAGGG